jgi:uncharacterized protein YcfL
MYNFFFITLLVFSFFGCSEKQYRNIYENQENIFDAHLNTRAENDNHNIQNGKNPMKRPSYDEYKER